MKSKIFIFIFPILLIFSFVFNADAQGRPYMPEIPKPQEATNPESAYRFYKDVDNLSINVPTVVEVLFEDDFIERFDFAVLDKTTNSFEPYYFRQETLVNEIPISISTVPNVANARLMIDKNTKTYTEFPLYSNDPEKVQIILSSDKPITSSLLTILLDNYVALPTSVEIRALVDGKNNIIVANKKMDQQTIRFPKTTSNKWYITFTYAQPFRISELRLNQENATRSNIRAIRFLAKPGHSYRIFFDPDRLVKIPVRESGNLVSATDILVIGNLQSKKNPDYVISDFDKDGIPDVQDNCVKTYNPDQEDINNNGRGDKCDDFDQDGVINSLDNCPNDPNRFQEDTDSDGIGDVCDEQESRITERYPWIPWMGIVFAAVVLIVLFAITAKETYKNNQDNIQ